MSARWWVYQRERFPVLAHGPLILAFSLSAVSYSALLRGATSLPPLGTVIAFVTAFLFFLQLRIADEFKDYEEDARFRPYRPVPRGLVSLRELGWVGLGAALVQGALALLAAPALTLILVAAWSYLALMSVEFFAPAWLKARPVTYLWTHMLIMPLVDFYATACEWLVRGASLPAGLSWFLLVSFLNGIVLEIGRKTRAPADEETGVETYSVLWGRRRAVLAWLGAMLACAGAAAMAARAIDFLQPAASVLTVLVASAAVVGVGFVRGAARGSGRRLEILSGIWTLSMYLVIGAVPFALRNLS
ncbi:MAG: UbiA family prenyltransferase [Gammaproteobacteria bacterium]